VREIGRATREILTSYLANLKNLNKGLTCSGEDIGLATGYWPKTACTTSVLLILIYDRERTPCLD